MLFLTNFPYFQLRSMISTYISTHVIEFILYIYICRFAAYRTEMYMFNFIEHIECLLPWNSMYILLLSCIFIVLHWEYSFKEIDSCKKKKGGDRQLCHELNDNYPLTTRKEDNEHFWYALPRSSLKPKGTILEVESRAWHVLQ